MTVQRRRLEWPPRRRTIRVRSGCCNPLSEILPPVVQRRCVRYGVRVSQQLAREHRHPHKQHGANRRIGWYTVRGPVAE